MEEMLQAAIPGESLTTDPENPQPYETAPEYTAVEDFIDDLFDKVTDEDMIDSVLDPLRKQIPVEDVAQMILFQAMATGKITPDLVLGSIEPTIYMLLGLAHYADIDPVIYPEESMGLGEGEDAEESDVDFESMSTPKGISNSLIDKIKTQGGGT